MTDGAFQEGAFVPAAANEGWLMVVRMAKQFADGHPLLPLGKVVPWGTFEQTVLGCCGKNPLPSSLMPVHQVPNFTKLSKEESVTVSVTESDWIQLGEPRGKPGSHGTRRH